MGEVVAPRASPAATAPANGGRQLALQVAGGPRRQLGAWDQWAQCRAVAAGGGGEGGVSRWHAQDGEQQALRSALHLLELGEGHRAAAIPVQRFHHLLAGPRAQRLAWPPRGAAVLDEPTLAVAPSGCREPWIIDTSSCTSSTLSVPPLSLSIKSNVNWVPRSSPG